MTARAACHRSNRTMYRNSLIFSSWLRLPVSVRVFVAEGLRRGAEPGLSLQCLSLISACFQCRFLVDGDIDQVVDHASFAAVLGHDCRPTSSRDDSAHCRADANLTTKSWRWSSVCPHRLARGSDYDNHPATPNNPLANIEYSLLNRQLWLSGPVLIIRIFRVLSGCILSVRVCANGAISGFIAIQVDLHRLATEFRRLIPFKGAVDAGNRHQFRLRALGEDACRSVTASLPASATAQQPVNMPLPSAITSAPALTMPATPARSAPAA